MSFIYGFVNFCWNEHFQQENLDFTFEENSEMLPKTEKNFCLSKYNIDDEKHGLLILVNGYEMVELIEITQDELEKNYKHEEYFYTWYELWEIYNRWIEEINEIDSNDGF